VAFSTPAKRIETFAARRGFFQACREGVITTITPTWSHGLEASRRSGFIGTHTAQSVSYARWCLTILKYGITAGDVIRHEGSSAQKILSIN
jgi:hypothetical protein